MTNHPFPCRWVSPDGVLEDGAPLPDDATPCHRAASPSGFCCWHLMATRLARPFKAVEGKPAELALFFFAMWATVGFFKMALSLALTFQSGLNPAAQGTYNPSFFALYSGLFFLSMGAAVCWFRKLRPSRAMLEAAPIWCTLSLLAAFSFQLFMPASVLSSWWVKAYLPFFYLGPIFFVFLVAEHRSGTAGVIIVLFGAGLLLASGLVCQILEVVYQLTGRFDYLRHVAPELRFRAAMASFSYGMLHCAAAIDLLVGIAVTGYLMTPFPSPNHPYLLLAQREPLPIRLGLLAPLFLVLLGQADILRQSSLLLFGWYALNFGLADPTLIYLAAVVGLHYLVARRRDS